MTTDTAVPPAQNEGHHRDDDNKVQHTPQGHPEGSSELRDLFVALGLTGTDYVSVLVQAQDADRPTATVEQAGAVEQHVTGHLTQGHDVWIGTNVSRPAGAGRKGDEDAVTQLRRVVFDLDVADQQQPGKGMPSTEAALAVIGTLSSMFGTGPRDLVWSGHGYQPYWSVEPFDLGAAGSPQRARAKSVLQRCQILAGRVAAAHGGTLDSIGNLDRVTRAPGTQNVKYLRRGIGPATRACRVPLETPGRSLTVEELEEALEAYAVDDTEPASAAEVVTYDGPAFEELDAHHKVRATGLYASNRDRLLGRARRLAALPEGVRVGTLDDPSDDKAVRLAAEVGWDGGVGQYLMVEAIRMTCTPYFPPERAGLIAELRAIEPTRAEDRPTWQRLVDRKLAAKAKYAAERGPIEPPPDFGRPSRSLEPLEPSDGLPVPAELARANVEGEGYIVPGAHGMPTDSRIIAEFCNEDLLYDAYYTQESGWLAWDSHVWTLVPEEAIQERFRRWCNSKVEKASAAGDDSGVKFYSQRLTAAKLQAIPRGCRGAMLVKAEIFDQQPDLLVVGNGTIDLRTATLGPFDPQHLITKWTRTPYMPEAVHPDWDAALQAVADDEVRDWFQLTTGQAATGHPASSDVLPVCVGGGSNGKSAVLAPLVPVLGDYADALSEKALLGDARAHSTDVADLRGLRLALVEELPDDGKLNSKRLKDMLGTKTMKARRMRENNVSWRPTHSLFVTTNHTPHVAETDEGTWRRLALVTFPFHYVEDPEKGNTSERREDPGLRDRLVAGHEGRHEAILAWVVEGARRWYAGGRTLPKGAGLPTQVVADTLGWRHESDFILRWFADVAEVVNDPASHCTTAELYRSFTEYMKGRDSELEAMKQLVFVQHLRSHDLVKRDRRVYYKDRHQRTEGEASRSRLRPFGSWSTPYSPPDRYPAVFGIRFKEAFREESNLPSDQQKEAHLGGAGGTTSLRAIAAPF